MEDTAMKKKAYEKPSMRVVELQHRTCLLQASSTPPEEIPDYDDWLGTRRSNGEDDWDDETDDTTGNGSIWD